MEENSYDIAIIGMACRIPGASDINEFWNNLINGVESITEFSKEELLASGEPAGKINNPKYVPRRGIVNGADKFDAAFFGFTPREAEILDPQHRIFLETCWHALEDGGYTAGREKHKIAVFGGAGTAWYLHDVHSNPKIRKVADSTSIVTGSDKDYLTTRVSYKLNLTGPSLDVQSACSTSMAAVILGIQNLQSYQTDLVLAGGVSVQYPEKVGYLYVPGSLESPDGHCRPFDKDAGGTAFSRGCGVVLLKRLDDALKDNDHIYAVIKAGTLNNDGSKKAGFTAPSVEGQKEAILETIETAGIDVEKIGMVEAHGTATPVGDPIEVGSLTEAFTAYTGKRSYCALGSVKSNIGHTDTASGVVALIKTALAVKYGKIPPSINFSAPNPKINFAETPFFVNTELRDWPDDKNRLALINSFGVGGTNACLILSNAIERPASNRASHSHYLLPVSARTEKVLDNYLAEMEAHIRQRPGLSLTDMAFTALCGREHFKHRAFIAFRDREHLLREMSENNWIRLKASQESRKLVFMFPGQGNQYLQMGRQLYAHYPHYRTIVDNCAQIVRDTTGVEILATVFAEKDNEPAKQRIDQTDLTQPAIFTMSYALARLLMSWGIEPDVLMGHSVGEYVAAAVSGIMSLTDALKAVSIRGAMVQKLPGGAMTAVLMEEHELLPLLGKNSSVGAINSPGVTVASGPYDEIEALEKHLREQRVFCKRIPTSHAFHSPMMDGMLEEFAEVVRSIDLESPQIPVISTVTGKPLTDEEATSVDYWVQHVSRAVRFSDAVQTMTELSPSMFLEVGPGQSLETAVKRHLGSDSEHAVCSTMRQSDEDETGGLIRSVGTLWSMGLDAEFELLFGDDQPGRVPLPLYPFDRKRFIVEKSKNQPAEETVAEGKIPDISRWGFYQGFKKTPDSRILLRQWLSNGTDGVHDLSKGLLLFEDETGLAGAIAGLVPGKNTVCVRKGGGFERINRNNYVINPSDRAHYKLLFDNLAADGVEPNTVLHMWNVSGSETPTEEVNRTLAFYSPLYIEQALIEKGESGMVNILFVCDGLIAVGSEPVLSPGKALLTGPVRTVRKEAKHIRARLVDIRTSVNDYTVLTNALLDEARFLTDDLVIALRQTGRWAENFETIDLTAPDGMQCSFTEGGVYLITGGTGGMGLEFAKYASRSAKCSLILTHYSELPPEEEWPAIAASGGNDSATEKVRSLAEIRQNGTELMLVRMDITNETDVVRLNEIIEARWGRLDGIIHAAGRAGGGIIALKTPGQAEEVLKPKVDGALLLHKHLAAFDPGFTVYFSSVTAVVPEPSRIDYMSANSFLDFYAHYQNGKGGRVLSINWGPWSKVGMAARWKEEQEKQQRKLFEHPKFYEAGLHADKKDGNKEVFLVGTDAANQWVYKEHILNGEETLVGTFIIDSFSQLGAKKFGPGAFSISNLYFFRPVPVKRNQQPFFRLLTTFENGKYLVKFQYLEATEDKARWVEAAGCVIGPAGEQKPSTVIIDNLLDGLPEDKAGQLMFMDVKKDGKQLLKFSERWMNVTSRYQTKSGFVVQLDLPGEFHRDFDLFMIHPAMLDALFANVFAHRTTGFYLPFSYETIEVFGRVEGRVIADIELPANFDEEPDTVVLNGTIYNEKGEVILRVRNYTLAKIEDTGKQEQQDTAGAGQEDENILPEEGIEVFERAMNYGFRGNLVLASTDIINDIETAFEEKEKVQDEEEEAATYDRPEVSSDYVAPENEIEEVIAKIWGQILGINRVGTHDKFNELGGNSLLVVQALSNISQAFEMEIPLSEFKDTSTVKSLADYVMNVLISDMDDAELDELLDEI